MGVHPGEREHAEDDFQQHVHGDAGELPAEDDGRAGEGDNLRLQQQQGAAGIGDGAQQRKNQLYLQCQQRPADQGGERQRQGGICLQQGPAERDFGGRRECEIQAELRRTGPPDNDAGGHGEQLTHPVDEHVEHAGPADEDDLRQRGSDQLCL